jgi:hypothetical protein
MSMSMPVGNHDETDHRFFFMVGVGCAASQEPPSSSQWLGWVFIETHELVI